jgi:hypothetical protein
MNNLSITCYLGPFKLYLTLFATFYDIQSDILLSQILFKGNKALMRGINKKESVFKGLYTLDIFTHNIAIKRKKDILIKKYFFLHNIVMTFLNI